MIKRQIPKSVLGKQSHAWVIPYRGYGGLIGWHPSFPSPRYYRTRFPRKIRRYILAQFKGQSGFTVRVTAMGHKVVCPGPTEQPSWRHATSWWSTLAYPLLVAGFIALILLKLWTHS